MHVMALRQEAGTLLVAIPKSLVRQLKLRQHRYVTIEATPDGRLIVTPLEVRLATTRDHPTARREGDPPPNQTAPPDDESGRTRRPD
jgi:antitoxin component of MazEF toxin-antitoxin module